MRAISLTYAPSVLDADGICASQTTSGAAYAVINGALASDGVATMGDQQIITIFSASNLAGLTFLATGSDRNGSVLTETITGPGAGLTVVSTKNFYTVSSIYVSAAAAAFTVGVNGKGSCKPIVLDQYLTPFDVAAAVISSTGGTYKLQYTYDAVFDATWANGTQTWFDSATTTGKTGAFVENITTPMIAIRYQITTAASPENLVIRVIQSGAQ